MYNFFLGLNSFYNPKLSQNNYNINFDFQMFQYSEIMKVDYQISNFLYYNI